MRVLLDTCVISELRCAGGNPLVRQRVADLNPDRLYLSVITLGEVTKGISLLPAGQRRRDLTTWLAGLEQQYADQILPVDHEAARIWGELSANAQLQGVQIPASDGLITATALRHGLQLMTRNTRDFAATGARIIDPWEE